MKTTCPKCNYTWYDDRYPLLGYICFKCGGFYSTEKARNACNCRGALTTPSTDDIHDLLMSDTERRGTTVSQSRFGEG